MCNTHNVQLPHELLHGNVVCTKRKMAQTGTVQLYSRIEGTFAIFMDNKRSTSTGHFVCLLLGVTNTLFSVQNTTSAL